MFKDTTGLQSANPEYENCKTNDPIFQGKKDGQLVIKTKCRPCLNKPIIKQTGNLNTKLDVKVKRLPDLELIIVFGADGYSSP